VQKFLGLANYYHQLIKGFALIARPLHDLVKKDQKWNWTERQEKAFRELKEWFTKELVLAVPDLDKRMKMEVDALDYAIGGVLSMEYEDCYDLRSLGLDKRTTLVLEKHKRTQ